MKNLFSVIAALTGLSLIFAAAGFITSLFSLGVVVTVIYILACVFGFSAIVLAAAGFIISSKKNNNHTTEIHNENKSEITDFNKIHNIGENHNNLKDNIDSNKE